ncbi:hypothetical protein SZN_04691 [Streptomyces zinciresistens K42]|uniref:Uncharacterized protein n=1 Tax=Streptomyces zinciresistens K42 TaxID=700597 RepID=G2G632_9ACTN|nr:hypothetical protein [Streptomyces zinciresistens]EGX61121.1 hypothetical protein SZN_04691 [Streptomyces zinciresistens K42]
MQSRGARAVLTELRSLAADDEERLTAAKDRLARAQEEMGAAQSAFDSASTRAEVSQRVACGAEELLADAAQMSDDVPEPPPTPDAAQPPEASRARPTLAQEILAFVRGQERGVQRWEIAAHLSAVRPDIKLSGAGTGTDRTSAGGSAGQGRTRCVRDPSGQGR